METTVKPSHPVMVDQLIVLYGEAALDSRIAGSRWYRESRREARRLSRDYAVTLSQGAGIIAALSPQVQWDVNLRLARQVAEHGEVNEGCLRQSADKAWRIWHGERPLRVLGGMKTRAFYRAIMGDDDSVVIDTWMLYAVGWPNRSVTAKQYLRVAAALAEAAEFVGEANATFQAIVWTHVRGRA